MAYSPNTGHGCGPYSTREFIDRIAERVTKDIRHMEVITHDPEGQRIKRLVVAACNESLALAIPREGAPTTHVTSEKDIQFKVEGKENIKGAKTLQPATSISTTSVCKTCMSLHDPREQYDHTPT